MYFGIYLEMRAKGEFMKYAITDDFVNRLRAESDIIGIISEYVPLKKKGKNFWGCCPFHHEKTPSFSVTPEKGFFYCFGCQSGGNVFNFLMKIENIGFIEAVRLLADKMNIPLPEIEKSSYDLAREKQLADLFKVNELARDFYHSCLVRTSYGKVAREYLASRGISIEDIKNFKLGFAPPHWDKLSQAFMERGIDSKLLVNAGLAIERSNNNGIYDRFRNRVMFPISDVRGKVIGFGGRVMDDSQPKYLNSPETPVFNKRHILYGLERAFKYIRDSGNSVVVEGYMDVIAAHKAGINNAVASLGTAFTPDQAKQILRLAQEIIFAYDSDAAGQNATVRALSIVQELGAKVRVLSIPEDKDPDEYIRKHGAAAFIGLLENADSLIDYQIKQAFKEFDYSSLEGKVAIVSKLVPVLAVSNNAVEVNSHIAHISQMLAIDEGAIRSELLKFIVNMKKDKTVSAGKTINKISLLSKPSEAVDQAEKSIIRLMYDNPELIPDIQTQLRVQDFQDENHKEIIKLIFETYNMGKNISDAGWCTNLSETANLELSRIMLLEVPDADAVQLVNDCMRTIRLSHLNLLYEEHRLRADELERMGDSRFLQELAESQRIKDEIKKLHNS